MRICECVRGEILASLGLRSALLEFGRARHVFAQSPFFVVNFSVGSFPRAPGHSRNANFTKGAWSKRDVIGVGKHLEPSIVAEMQQALAVILFRCRTCSTEVAPGFVGFRVGRATDYVCSIIQRHLPRHALSISQGRRARRLQKQKVLPLQQVGSSARQFFTSCVSCKFSLLSGSTIVGWSPGACTGGRTPYPHPPAWCATSGQTRVLFFLLPPAAAAQVLPLLLKNLGVRCLTNLSVSFVAAEQCVWKSALR